MGNAAVGASVTEATLPEPIVGDRTAQDALSAPPAADLVISLINHSNPELLRDCLRSIYATEASKLRLDIYIVDNATDGRLVPEIRAEFPQTRWIFNRERLGFSANHNQVLAHVMAHEQAQADDGQGRCYLCILNDDIVVHPGAFERLARYLDENPEVGIAGPRLLNTDGSRQDCAFRFPTLVSEWAGFALLPGPLNALKAKSIDRAAQLRDTPSEVDWVLGACMVFRPEMLRQIGLLDAELAPIVYMEEPDICLRATRAGWKTVTLPQAVMTHFGGQTTKGYAQTFNPLTLELNRVHIAFFRKHYGLAASIALRLIYALTFVWNALMLAQGRIRGSLSTAEFKSQFLLYAHVARISLFSSCREPILKRKSDGDSEGIKGAGSPQ